MTTPFPNSSALVSTTCFLTCTFFLLLSHASASASICRQSCGYEAIGHSECEGIGCCWDTANDRCFHKGHYERSCEASLAVPPCYPLRTRCGNGILEIPCDAADGDGKDSTYAESSEKVVVEDSGTEGWSTVTEGEEAFEKLPAEDDPTGGLSAVASEEMIHGNETYEGTGMIEESGLRYIPKENDPTSQSANTSVETDAHLSTSDSTEGTGDVEERASESHAGDDLTESDQEASTSHLGTEEIETPVGDLNVTTESQVDQKLESEEREAETQHAMTEPFSGGESEGDSKHLEAQEIHLGDTGFAQMMPDIQTVPGGEGIGMLPEEEEMVEEVLAQDIDPAVMQRSEKEAADSVQRVTDVMTTKLAGVITGLSNVGKTKTAKTTPDTTHRPVYSTVPVPAMKLVECSKDAPAASRKEQSTYAFQGLEQKVIEAEPTGLRSDPALESFPVSASHPRHDRSRKRRAGKEKDAVSFHMDFSMDASGIQKTSTPKHKKRHNPRKHQMSDDANCRVYTLTPCGTEFLNEEECKNAGCCWLKINRNFIEGCYLSQSQSSISQF